MSNSFYATSLDTCAFARNKCLDYCLKNNSNPNYDCHDAVNSAYDVCRNHEDKENDLSAFPARCYQSKNIIDLRGQGKKDFFDELFHYIRSF